MRRLTTRHSARTCCAFALSAGLTFLAAPMHVGAAPTEPPSEQPVAVDDAEPETPTAEPIPADTAAWYIDAENTELTGLDPDVRIRFRVPPGWVPSADAAVEIPFAVDSAASGVISVSTNGDYVGTSTFDSADGTARIIIPADSIKSGTNTVDISASINLTIDGESKDPAHPARRMQLGDDTRVLVPLRAEAGTTLTDFPEVLEPLGSQDRVVDVHLIDAGDGPRLTAVAPLISAIRDAVDLPVELALTVHDSGAAFDGSQLDPSRPSIVIGTVDSVRSAPAVSDITELPADASLAGHIGVVALGATAVGAPVLVIAGTTADDIASAADAIANSRTRTKLDGAINLITASEPRVESTLESEFTLKDRGYPDRTLSGPGRDATLYAFDVPIISTPDTATLRLSAGRSANALDVLGIAVLINGNRSGVIPFDENGLIDGSALTIQRGVLRPGRNFVRFEADFAEVLSDQSTAPRQSIEISSDTLIELSTPAPRAAIDLDDLPYTFRSDADAAQLRIVLPTDATSTDQITAIDLAVLLGNTELPARIVDADELDPATLRDHHLVILGEPDRQPLHEWLGLDVADEIESIAPDDRPDVDLRAVVTAHQNPASAQHVALILTGLTSDDAQQAADAVLDVKLRGSLSGHTTGVGHDGDKVVFGTTRRPLELLISDPTDAATIDVDSASAIVEPALDSPSSSTESAAASSTEAPGDSGDTNRFIMVAIAGVVLLLLLAAAAIFFMRVRRGEDVADATDFTTPDEGDGRDDD